jgi:20S proteasome subunit beta 2
MRNHITPNVRMPKEQSYKFPRGTTAYLKEVKVEKKDLKKYVTIVDLGASAPVPAGTVAAEDHMEVDA